jgi:hypothetical protein
MSYRTVRGLWERYRRRGPAGLETDYAQCARCGPRFESSVPEAALQLKRDHPRWGATLIRLQLGKQFGGQPLPSDRTLQNWFRQADLTPRRPQRPQPDRQRAQRPHQVWQVDAKEQIPLADGSRCTAFCATDEASGALLGAALFPPGPLRCGLCLPDPAVDGTAL